VQELTPEIRDKILEAVRKLHRIEVVAVEAGVSKATIAAWQEQGQKETSGIYKDFVLAMGEAEMEGVERYRGIIRKAASEGDKWSQNWLKENDV
jgi:hypothetical protein